MNGEFTERVLQLVEQIPPGRVLSYGVIAAIVNEESGVQGGGPRQVGHVMAMDGGGVPWWRVVRADGRPPLCHDGTALQHYAAEGTPLRAGGTSVDIRTALWRTAD